MTAPWPTDDPDLDIAIRVLYELDQSTDLDKPRANLGFRSYREVAQEDAEQWGMQ